MKISGIYHGKSHFSFRTKYKKRKRSPGPIIVSGSQKTKEQFAAGMRSKPTSLEVRLGYRLAFVIGREFAIETQVVLRGYILDFYLPELRLCFEADGPQHNETSDRIRDTNLFKAGIRTIRFSTRELQHEPDAVDTVIRLEILQACKRLNKHR